MDRWIVVVVGLVVVGRLDRGLGVHLGCIDFAVGFGERENV